MSAKDFWKDNLHTFNLKEFIIYTLWVTTALFNLWYAAYVLDQFSVLPEIGPADRKLPQPLLFIFFLISLAYWIIAFIPFLRRKREKENLEESGEIVVPSKITIHALLPLSGQENTAKGDGLLQAAGLLAAQEELGDDLVIKFRDHKNSVKESLVIVDDLMKNWTLSDGPLWLIITMSRVAVTLHSKILERLEANTTLRDNFTAIFTVASSPDVPHKPEDGIFKYTVHAEDEVEKFFEYLQNGRLEKPLILAAMDSTYPRAAVSQLSAKLASDRSCPIILSVPLDKHGQVESKLSIINSLDSDLAIIFAYDLPLIGAFEVLVESGFRGQIMGPTTFSVKDWQQYLRTHRKDLQSKELTYYCLKIHGSYNATNAAKFVEFIRPFNFNTVTGSKAVYGDNFGEPIRNSFNEKEKKVYQKIDPNYISALCYDAVRMVYYCNRKNLKKLSSFEDVKADFELNPGPLGGIDIMPGKTPSFKPRNKLEVRRVRL